MPDATELKSRFRGCLLGLACGDAVGTTLEFNLRGSFAPIKDMVGGGPFGLKPGEWTDDTSMALCLAESLLEAGGFDAEDQMQRYCRWRDDGYLSSNGRCFDIGNTISAALSRFTRTGDPFSGSTEPHSAGNGSLMRLAPVPLYYYPNLEQAVSFSVESSRTTHGAAECLEACHLFSFLLLGALAGHDKDEVLASPNAVAYECEKIGAIAAGTWRNKTEVGIRGTGYVVQSLEAALWCFANTDSFETAILAAANLGDDADTTAAICGQIAGAFYGVEGIPEHWRDKVVWADRIIGLADRLFKAGQE